VANVEGRATAITVLTPVKPGWWIWLTVLFWLGRHITASLKKLQTLSFIHYARWSIIRRMPSNAGVGGSERLHHTYLLFESNFNGTWDEYIDAFSEVVPSRMRAIWGSSYGFPGPLPVGPFKAYIRRNELVANHFWSAYPQATTTQIISAARVASSLADFQRQAQRLTAEDFPQAYEEFLSRIQRDL
jgi:hypothetical protein